MYLVAVKILTQSDFKIWFLTAILKEIRLAFDFMMGLSNKETILLL